MKQLPQTELNRKIADGSSVQKECSEIEEDLASLKAAYEQYFLGLERHPPRDKHKALAQRVRKLTSAFVRQTGVKFRINSVQQKVSTYERLWEKTIMEMEAGTYRRDVFKAKLRAKKEQQEQAPQQKAPEAAVAAAGSPGAPAARAAAPRAAPPPVPNQDVLPDNKAKAIFDAYLTAKQRCSEDTSRLTYDAVAANLRKQIPELLKKHNARSVEFKVVIKDGKAILRAVPKE